MLVPYALGEREGWTLMRDQYSSAVGAYTREIGNGFVLDEAGISEAKRLYATRLRQERIDALKWLFGGLAVGWLVTFLIGWIVRGFMGIPIGLDVKP